MFHTRGDALLDQSRLQLPSTLLSVLAVCRSYAVKINITVLVMTESTHQQLLKSFADIRTHLSVVRNEYKLASPMLILVQ